MLKFFKQSFVNQLTPLILVLMLLILVTVILSQLTQTGLRRSVSRQDFSDEEDLRLVKVVNDPKKQKASFTEYKPDIAFLIREGIAAWNTGKMEAAEDRFRTVLLFQPSNPIALAYLGTLFMHQGRYANAEYIIRLRIKYYPQDVNAQLEMSSLYLRLEHVKQALASGKKAFRINPDSAAVALNLARIYARAGEQGLMFHYLRLAIQNSHKPIQELLWDPAFDEYRNASEYQKLLEETMSSGDEK